MSQLVQKVLHLRQQLAAFTQGMLCVALMFCVQSTSFANAANNNCEGSSCENQAAAYQLKIIQSGEANPVVPNNNNENRQKNRRAEVSIATNVSKSIEAADHSAAISGGASVWLSKDPTSLDKQLDVSAKGTLVIASDDTVEPVQFTIRSNYLAFIERWEVVIFYADRSVAMSPIHRIELSEKHALQTIEWKPDITQLGLQENDELSYAIRAYGANDAIDQSRRQTIRFIKETERSNKQPISPFQALQDKTDSNGAFSELERSAISIQGTKVRLLADNVQNGQTVWVNNVAHQAESGRLGLEYILPQGVHTFYVQIIQDEAIQLDKVLRIDVDNDYFFMVALADLSAGKNTVSGSIETLAADEQHYGGDIFVDGRLAFYLKGKVKGKYLVTAQMDTGTNDIGHLLDDFHDREAGSVFRRIDPDQYYPVYGDGSTLTDDTDSQGKLYVRVDWERSRLLWGNYNTSFSGTEFAQFNRSLYGAQLVYRSTEDTALGDEKTQLSAFGSQAQSMFRRNEFIGTGGSLYYLRDTDIVIGSEKIWVEVRQPDTNRVIQKIALQVDRDYEIDNFQGRVLLTRPLLSVTADGAPSIIRDEPLAGNKTYLVVDYEYIPQGISLSGTSTGVRGKQWLSDNTAVGGTWVHETRADTDYDLKGADLTLKKSDKTFLKAEIAQSQSVQTGSSFLSDDGGLNFNSLNGDTEEEKGTATGIEFRVSRSDFNPDASEMEISGWAKQQQVGFATANSSNNNDITNVGFEMISELSKRSSIVGQAQWNKTRGESIDSLVGVKLDHELGTKTIVSAELRHSRESNLAANTQGQATILAGKVSTDFTDQLTLYSIHQSTLARSGVKQSNNATTVGASFDASSTFNIKGEFSRGEQGNSALLGTEVDINQTYSVYSNYTYSFNRDRLEQNAFIFGQRKSIGSQLSVFTEHQFLDEDKRNGYGHTVGLEQKLTESAFASLTVQYALLEHENGDITERNTVSTGFRYQKDDIKLGSKIEYRWDDNTNEDVRQWVVANHFEYRRDASLRWQGKFNASWTDNEQDTQEDARFIEAGFGFALRPVENDRLNLLARFTYLSDLQPESQDSNEDQRSWIASTEGLYELTRHWSVGGKLAHRTSEIRLTRNTGDWIANDASLAAFRLRYKAPFRLEAGLAYHWLYSENSDGLNHGTLITLGKQVSNNLTFSVGYNFTQFDDNLKNDDYDVKGWFVNLIGTY